MDPYKILGVNREASQADIKKAYRDLAKKFHPDTSKEPEAERRFKEISQAYEILSDPAKRNHFDKYGFGNKSNYQGDGGFGFSDFGSNFEDIFNDFFTKEKKSKKGEDLLYRLNVDFTDVVFGSKRTVKFKKNISCLDCHGKGFKSELDAQACRQCNGRGKIKVQQGFFMVDKPCPSCGGKGNIVHNPCTSCSGKGIKKIDRTIEVTIPQGINDKTRLKLSGEGNISGRGEKPGDLYIEVNVKEQPGCRREGDDIHLDVPIPFYDAILGGEVDVPTTTGTVRMRIPEGSKQGDIHRLPNKGISKTNGTKGHLFVHLILSLPQNLTKEQKAVLEHFRNLNEGNNFQDNWFQKIKNLWSN